MSYSLIQQSAHIQADTQMGEDNSIGLDGGLFFMSAKMLRENLEKYQDQPNWGEEVKKGLKVIREYEKWSNQMAAIMPARFVSINPTNLVEDLAKDLRSRIKELKEGESFLVPVNIKPPGGGFHTISVGIKREQNGRFSLNVYNLGLGSGNHYRDTNGKVYPFHIRNIPGGEITKLEFLKGFVDQATFKKEDTPGADNFYQFLNDNLKGVDKGNEPDPTKDEEAYPLPSKLQDSGTCIWRSALEGLRDHMEPQAYKAFVFAMKRDNIDELCRKYLKDDLEKGVNPKEWKGDKVKAQRLVEIGIDEFEKRVSKAHARYAQVEEDAQKLNELQKLKSRITIS